MLDHNLEPVPSKPLRRLSLKPSLADKARGEDKGEHFVEPWRLDDQQKKALVAALKKRKIGDGEGRRLFVNVLEYELSGFRAAEAASPVAEAAAPPPPQVDATTLQAIDELARALAARLGEIPEDQEPQLLETLAAQDEMGRGYGVRYLDTLYQEASRLAQACATVTANLAAPPPEAAAEPSGPSPAMLGLVASLAHVFEECFEQPPTAAARGQFAVTLKLVANGVGLDIPRDKTLLEQVLAAD